MHDLIYWSYPPSYDPFAIRMYEAKGLTDAMDAGTRWRMTRDLTTLENGASNAVVAGISGRLPLALAAAMMNRCSIEHRPGFEPEKGRLFGVIHFDHLNRTRF